MKRMLISLKKKVDPSHKLIAPEYVTDEEVKAIRKKYGNQFLPDEPIVQYLSDQLVMISFLVWIELTPHLIRLRFGKSPQPCMR